MSERPFKSEIAPAVLLFLLIAAPVPGEAAPGGKSGKDPVFPPPAGVVFEKLGDACLDDRGLAFDGDDMVMLCSPQIRRRRIVGTDLEDDVVVATRPRELRLNGLIIEGDDLFWTERAGDWDWRVATVPKRGGRVRQLFRGFIAPDSLAVDANAVWFSTGSDREHPNRIVSVPRRGPHKVKELAALKGTVCTLGLDDKFVYASQCDERQIVRIPRSGGSPQLLATSINEPYRITLVRDRVIFDHRGHGGIFEVPKTGGQPMPLTLLAALTNFYVADEQDLFFFPTPPGGHWTGRDATVVWEHRDPKTTSTLDPDLGYPRIIAIDPTYVYWQGNGPLLRARRRFPLQFLPDNARTQPAK